ncbi:MAG TPA: hypothetical protein VGY76_12075 [Solirubrobacteraceae bacterium]|jgi:hypothetical protein|nr:hypothetical protein [Solirubrobacteraceae bacterium]
MVAADVTVSRPRRAGRRRLGELRRAWLAEYAATWIVTLVPAALLAIDLARLNGLVRHVLGASLNPQRNPPPNIGHVLALLAHNLPLAAWPLLLGVVGAHRRHLARQITDTVVATWLTANVLPVGAALGAYGSPMLRYLPQVPFEWAALALGASAWLLQRRHPLTVGEGAALFALIAGALLCAAVLETVAVPHR